MNDSLINKATSLIDTGDINGSINLLNEILQNYPSDWKVHFNLACAYKTIGNYERAKVSYIKATELDSEGYLCNFLGLSEVYLLVSDFEKGIENLRKVFSSKHQMNEGVIEIVNGMGITFYQNSEFEKAKEVFEQASKILWDVVFIKIKQSSDYPNKYIIHTINNNSTIDLDKAFNDFFKMEHLCCQIKNNLGASLAKLGLLEEAKVAFKESMEYTPEGFDYQAPIIALKEIEDMQKEEKEIFKRLGYKEDEILESGKLIIKSNIKENKDQSTNKPHAGNSTLPKAGRTWWQKLFSSE